MTVEVCTVRIGTKCPKGKEEGQSCFSWENIDPCIAAFSAAVEEFEVVVTKKSEFQDIIAMSFDLIAHRKLTYFQTMSADFVDDFPKEKITNLAIIAAAQKTGDLKTACEEAAKKV